MTAKPNEEKKLKKSRASPNFKDFKQRFVIHPVELTPTRSELSKQQHSKQDSVELTLDLNMTEEIIRELLVRHLPKLDGVSFRFATRDGTGMLFECPCKSRCHTHHPAAAPWNGINIKRAARSNSSVYILNEDLARNIFAPREVPSNWDVFDTDSAYGSPEMESSTAVLPTFTTTDAGKSQIAPATKPLKRFSSGEPKSPSYPLLLSTSAFETGSTSLKKSRSCVPNLETTAKQRDKVSVSSSTSEERCDMDSAYYSPLVANMFDYNMENLPVQSNAPEPEEDPMMTVFQRYSPRSSMDLLESSDLPSSSAAFYHRNHMQQPGLKKGQPRHTLAGPSKSDSLDEVIPAISGVQGDVQEPQGRASSQERKRVFIGPENSDVTGGGTFLIVVEGGLPNVPGGYKVQFDKDGPIVPCVKINSCTLRGIIPARSDPGVVLVYVPVGNIVGSVAFEYTAEKDLKRYIDKEVTTKKKADEVFALLVAKLGEIGLASEEGDSGTGKQQNESGRSQALALFRMVVETAAKINAVEFFDILFRTHVGRSVFKTCKEEGQLLEEIARESGHEELACFLEEEHSKYRAVESDSDDEVDWKALTKAAKEYQRRCAEINEEASIENLSSSDGRDDYFGDAENSSSFSAELSDLTSDQDESLSTNVVKGITNSRGRIPIDFISITSSLPRRVCPLFGRDKECNEIIENLQWNNDGVGFIYGVPGVGKTSVCVHIGHELQSMGWTVQYESCRNRNKEGRSILLLLSECAYPDVNSDYPFQGRGSAVASMCHAISAISERTLFILEDMERLFVADEQGIMRKALKTLVEAAAKNRFVRILFSSCEKEHFLENVGFYFNLESLNSTAAANLLQHLTRNVLFGDAKSIAQSCGCKPVVINIVSILLSEGILLESDIINIFSSYDDSRDISCNKYLDPHFKMIAKFSLDNVPEKTKAVFEDLCRPGRGIIKVEDLMPIILLKDVAVLRESLMLLNSLRLVEYNHRTDEFSLSEMAFRFSFACSCDPGDSGMDELIPPVKRSVQKSSLRLVPNKDFRVNVELSDIVQIYKSTQINAKVDDPGSPVWKRMTYPQNAGAPCSFEGTKSTTSSTEFFLNSFEHISTTRHIGKPPSVERGISRQKPSKQSNQSDSGLSEKRMQSTVNSGSTSERVSHSKHFKEATGCKPSKNDSLIIDFDIPPNHGISQVLHETISKSRHRFQTDKIRGFYGVVFALISLAAVSSLVTFLAFELEKQGAGETNLELEDMYNTSLLNEANVSCTVYQYNVKNPDGTTECRNCPLCPAGTEVYPPCGNSIETSAFDYTECRACEEGFYRQGVGVWSCMTCSHCVEDQVLLKSCTKYSDAVCAEPCQSSDMYYDYYRGQCMPCSSCCGDDKDARVPECEQKRGSQSDKICSFRGRDTLCNSRPANVTKGNINGSVATVSCRFSQYKLVRSDGTQYCTDCPSCAAGHELYPPCGRTISGNSFFECRVCRKGFYSGNEGVRGCTPCSHCAEDRGVLKSCTKYSDTVCGG